MKVVTLKSPSGLDKLQLVEREAPGEPGPGEDRVRLHASPRATPTPRRRP
ncbi:hypothetical protein [Halomonas ramblicola]